MMDVLYAAAAGLDSGGKCSKGIVHRQFYFLKFPSVED